MTVVEEPRCVCESDVRESRPSAEASGSSPQSTGYFCLLLDMFVMPLMKKDTLDV